MLLSVQKDNILLSIVLSIPSCRCSELGELERSIGEVGGFVDLGSGGCWEEWGG